MNADTIDEKTIITIATFSPIAPWKAEVSAAKLEESSF